MKTPEYCRIEVSGLHKFFTRNVFFAPWEQKEVTQSKIRQVRRVREHNNLFPLRRSCIIDALCDDVCYEQSGIGQTSCGLQFLKYFFYFGKTLLL